MKRVVVTGMGALCGLGHDLPSVWENVIAGKNGITKIENIDCSDLSTQIAGEIKNFKMDPELFSDKECERFDLFNQYALHAAKEAITQSGILTDQADYPRERIGCIMGIGLGGLPHIVKNTQALMEKGPRRVSPFMIPSIIANMAPGLISIKFGLKGPNFVATSACASSAHALTVASREIMCGSADVMVTGGAEGVITQLGLAGFGNMKALSKNNDNPEKASRPFDVDRDGFVMGEGAGIIVLEEYEKAKARGAKIYAEVIGHGMSGDSYHITAPHPDGEGAIAAMKNALISASLSPEQVGYINAHGTSTPMGDIAETKAIKEVFGTHAKNISISSTKSMVGHLLGAAGGLESIFSIMALETGVIPPTMNIDSQDPECDLDYTANKAVKKQVEFALNNSFGFGGTNSALIFKKI